LKNEDARVDYILQIRKIENIQVPQSWIEKIMMWREMKEDGENISPHLEFVRNDLWTQLRI